jgi:hypothetical protein
MEGRWRIGNTGFDEIARPLSALPRANSLSGFHDVVASRQEGKR